MFQQQPAPCRLSEVSQSAEGLVEVTYTTTIDDYVAWNMHSLKRSKSMTLRFVLNWVMPPLLCGIVAVVLGEGYPLLAVLLAISGVLYAVSYPFVYHAMVSSAVRAYAQDLGTQGVIGRLTLILEEDTLTERTKSVQSVARWRDMKGMEVVGDCTYIYVTGLLAAIIPRHGFERPEEYEAVRDFALGKLTNPVPAPADS
jgi:YcxB-like protein